MSLANPRFLDDFDNFHTAMNDRRVSRHTQTDYPQGWSGFGKNFSNFLLSESGQKLGFSEPSEKGHEHGNSQDLATEC